MRAARIRQTFVSYFSRWHRNHTGRLRAKGKSRSVRIAQRIDSGIQRHCHRQDSRRAARHRRLRNRRHKNPDCAKSPRKSALSHPAQGAWRRFSPESPPLMDSFTPPGRHSSYSRGSHFRAEKSKTRRHLTEFWMLEPEAAYADLADMMTLAEGLVSSVVQAVIENKSRELEVLKRDIAQLENVKPPFPRVTYEEALAVLNKHGNSAKFGDDFGGDEETIISKEFDRPVMVHRYPAAIKAFYMQPDTQRPDLALAFDMIAPQGYGEIIGGSQRIHDYDLLVKRRREHNLPVEPFQWYLDLRRYGSVPHAGFGLGLERTVAWLCGTEHIREVIPFPRMIYRVYP